MSSFKNKESLLEIVAAKIIKENGKKVSICNEKARIERLAENEYKRTESEYNSFVYAWVLHNAKRLIFGELVYADTVIPDFLETNLDNYCRN